MTEDELSSCRAQLRRMAAMAHTLPLGDFLDATDDRDPMRPLAASLRAFQAEAVAAGAHEPALWVEARRGPGIIVPGGPVPAKLARA